MKKVFLFLILGALFLITGLGLAVSPKAQSIFSKARPLPGTISGTVTIVDTQTPVPGANVQVQGTPNRTTTDEDGWFSLRGLSGTEPITITASTEGYYVGWVRVDPNSAEVAANAKSLSINIAVKPIYATDNHLYPWFSLKEIKGTASCGVCHEEYVEWQKDAHSQSATNLRFRTLYQGTDAQGNKGQFTVYGSNGKALPPDQHQPYYGPGYKLDNPQRHGNCATCHTPVAGKIPNQKNCGWSGCHTDLTSERAGNVMDAGVSPLSLSGDAAEGITCDFCHKIGAVILDSHTKLPLADMPGILSMRLYRPEEGSQLFFGTVPDVSRRVSYSPLEAKSEFCAPCHYGVFGGIVGNGSVANGVVIYNSYGEWLESDYSDPESGKTCQQCHMPISDRNTFVFPAAGGLARDYIDLHQHTMPGAADETLLQNAVSLESTAQHLGNQLQVTVKVTNDQTGHHVPTDAPIREMILVVTAVDSDGNRLSLIQGPVLPGWSGNYANQPGKTYSKILRDDWSGEMPTAAYWRPVTIVQDTRLAAWATDISQYSFPLPAGKTAQVQVQLIFRRAFQALAEQKGWNDPDILMEETTIQVEK